MRTVVVKDLLERPVDRFEEPSTTDLYLGLDLGRQKDPSALVAVRRNEFDTPGGAWRLRRYSCVGVRRWQLGTPYPDVVREVRATMERDDLRGARLVVDASGVGMPVVDWMRESGIQHTPVMIVGGTGQSVDNSGLWRVAKHLLVGIAQHLFRERMLVFASGMDVLLDELTKYRVEVTKSGNEVYSAREGEHDDTVMALCLALWYGERATRRMKVRL